MTATIQQGSNQVNLTMLQLQQQQKVPTATCPVWCLGFNWTNPFTGVCYNLYDLPGCDCQGCQKANNNIGANSNPGNLGANVGGQINDTASSSLLAPFFSAASSWGMHIALFLGAILLVIVGLWVLTQNQGTPTGTVSSGMNSAAGGNS
jgi:hypothetical protein